LDCCCYVEQEQIDRTRVSQSLLNDLVSDVSKELHQHRVDNIVDRQSAFLRDVPSVSTLLQRLQDMEVGYKIWLCATVETHNVIA